jgi:phage major head subunit gpT-like protein
MTINTTQIANLLRPGLAAVFGDYPQYPSQWSEIFDVYESDKQQEIEVEMKMLGLAQIRPEGSPTAMDTMGQRIITTYLHKYVALGFSITRQAIMDNLYKTKFPLMVRALKKSLAQTKEILGAAVLNNGFNAAFPIGDGQPLFSLNHPIDGNVVPNTPAVQADLNEASLESAIITIQQFRDQAGLIVQTKPKKLIVPPQGQFVAERLLASAFRTGTPNNDVSALYNLTIVPEGYRTNQYLTIANSWYVLTDAPDAFKHYVRESVETDVYTDFSTDNLLAKAVERYSFGVSNFRGGYGSEGT